MKVLEFLKPIDVVFVGFVLQRIFKNSGRSEDICVKTGKTFNIELIFMPTANSFLPQPFLYFLVSVPLYTLKNYQ